MTSILGCAGDGGARAAVGALSGWPAFQWADGSAGDDPGRWGDYLATGRWRILVCGASDSPAARAMESAARRAARHAGLKVVVVEDLPGNYYAIDSAPIDLLVVESDAARELARLRWGRDAPPIEVVPAVRYDSLRRRLSALRAAATATSMPLQVLWAGQPETEDCLRTLTALAPAIIDAGSSLLLKAHPRDAGYRTGIYPKALAELRLAFEDVTAASVDAVLALRPRLVVTQFSSVAVEAGFWGVPALHVLLPDAGGARLMSKKGYAIPPWCLAGAALYANNPTQIKGLMHDALHDEGRRAAIIGSFDTYFAVGAEAVPQLIARLAKL